ncbi:hypothetical protein [Asaccharospora irregularis]|uniref:Uncharacterized protein n=1 Tax=Asaccharospora irregularis DSM 2635 TaxID=1121321 RepID=A0A1M5PEE1_9FIRM|nr:hypothetical protein [Asaccharospora irregularis]SHH00122.1 hypothetical protein SAMN04488530_1144 [Asaccharospora irregularis DSM 2635]
MGSNSMNKDVVIEAAIQAIPYVGAPLATLYYGNKQEKRFRRLEKFYEELKEEISKSQNNYKDISQHNPDELSAILEELNEKVESEHLELKRRLYKNYFKKTMIQPVNGNFDERKLLLDILSTLTPLQIEIIAFLAKQASPVQGSSISKPGIEQSVISGSIAQLKNFGLIDGALNSIVFGGAGNSINENIVLSNFGKKFNTFCLS